VQVAKNVFVNFDVKKLYIKTGATLGGSSLGTLKLNPLIIGMGVGMKF
jgi:outer membrane protein